MHAFVYAVLCVARLLYCIVTWVVLSVFLQTESSGDTATRSPRTARLWECPGLPGPPTLHEPREGWWGGEGPFPLVAPKGLVEPRASVPGWLFQCTDTRASLPGHMGSGPRHVACQSSARALRVPRVNMLELIVRCVRTKTIATSEHLASEGLHDLERRGCTWASLTESAVHVVRCRSRNSQAKVCPPCQHSRGTGKPFGGP